MDVERAVSSFISENFYVADAAEVTRTTSLYERGIVDSTGLLEIVAFLEKEFGIVVFDDEVTPDNLDTVERISAYVARKRPA